MTNLILWQSKLKVFLAVVAFLLSERRFVRAGCRSQLETTQNPKFERSDKHFFENRKLNNPTRTRFFARKKTSRSRTLFVLSLRGACLFSLSLQGPRFVFAVVPGALLFFYSPFRTGGRTWGGANRKRFLKHLLAQHAVATWHTYILYIPTHVRGRRKASERTQTDVSFASSSCPVFAAPGETS